MRILLLTLFLTCWLPGNQTDLTPYVFPVLKGFPKMPENKENPLSQEGFRLGRYLFYDPILSKDSTLSCASCHRQEVAFSDSPKKFSAGTRGLAARRNTPPLYNLAWYPSLFWDGRSPSIEEQVFHPLRNHTEMDLPWQEAEKRLNRSKFYVHRFDSVFGSGRIDSIKISKAIAQFERALISSNSKYDQVLRGERYLSKEEYQGFVIMNEQDKGNCLQCHTTDANALGTTLKFSEIGLDPIDDPEDYFDKGKGGISGKKEELGWFKIPSLRNVALTPPYMHDGRFENLEQVLDFYSEGVHESINLDSKMSHARQGGVQLSGEEKKQIIAFLHCLSDSSFISDSRFSNPWK